MPGSLTIIVQDPLVIGIVCSSEMIVIRKTRARGSNVVVPGMVIMRRVVIVNAGSHMGVVSVIKQIQMHVRIGIVGWVVSNTMAIGTGRAVANR